MNESIKQEGVLVRWNPDSLYGFVDHETLETSSLTKARFFLHWSRVVYCERGATPQLGDRVFFIPSKAPAKPGKAQFIVEAEIYNPVEAAKVVA